MYSLLADVQVLCSKKVVTKNVLRGGKEVEIMKEFRGKVTMTDIAPREPRLLERLS